MKTLFRGGYIYSPVPEATALLIEGDKIVWVGDDAASLVYLEDDTEVVELDGAFVCPPFIDGSDLESDSVTFLTAEPSESELAELVRQYESGESQITVCLDPVLAATAKALASAGIPYCFGSFGKHESPWDWIASATGTPEQPGLTERAAFLAATRGPLRVFSNVDWQTQAILDGGASADFAIWQAEQIDVRAADPRIAAWSTDPRSGVPGLPEVGPGLPKPELQSMYVGGVKQPQSKGYLTVGNGTSRG